MSTSEAALVRTEPTALSAKAVEALLVDGDLSSLSAADRVTYYHRVCESVGLNPLTKPFAYIKLNGKLTLYALRDCTEQLRKIHGVSVSHMTTELIGDVYVVRATFTDKTGRTDQATGAVPVKGLTGENLANAYLKAETKCKRRGTLSICGLGMLDETEVASIPGAKPEAVEGPSSFAPPRRASAAPVAVVERVTVEEAVEVFSDSTPLSVEELAALDQADAVTQDEAPTSEASAQLVLPTAPPDAISKARIGRVYFLIHAALEAKGADNEENMHAVQERLDQLVQKHCDRARWQHVSWRKNGSDKSDYERVCDAIPAIVEKVCQ